MIEILGYSDIAINYRVEYYRPVNIVNVITEYMDDSCTPYQESTKCMIWLNTNKVLGEIECILPAMVEADVAITGLTEIRNRTPLLKVTREEKAIGLCIREDRLIIVFGEVEKSRTKCISSNVNYYLNKKEVVAMECFGVNCFFS